MLRDVLAPMLGRPVDELRELALPIGSAEQCAERISDYQDAGVGRIFVWPLADELDQLERFRNDVVPLVPVGEGTVSNVPLCDHARMPPLRARERAQLPDSAFAYIDSRGQRRLPIHDAAHVRNALARFGQVAFEDEAARDRARNRLLRAAEKHGICRSASSARSWSRSGSCQKGNLTFLLTDIEGSTELLGRLDDGYAPLLADIRRLVKAGVAQRVDTRCLPVGTTSSRCSSMPRERWRPRWRSSGGCATGPGPVGAM